MRDRRDDEPLRLPVAESLVERRWRLIDPSSRLSGADEDAARRAWWPAGLESVVRASQGNDGEALSEDDGFDQPDLANYGLQRRDSVAMARWHGVLAFGREHVVVVVVALAVGLVFAVMTFLHSRPDVVPLSGAGGASPSVGGQVSATATPSAQPSPDPVVKVHVLGAVVRPGVVTLPRGARVQDAIEAAGGLAADADPAQLNLAAVLDDGSQIVIGTTAQPDGRVNGGTGGTGGATDAKVNLNTASQAELETLPGIGPVTAQKIMTWRDQHGRFSDISELQEIDGIGPKTMAQLEPYVCV